MKENIYFDNAATSFPKPDAVPREVLRYMTKIGCNVNRSSYEGAYTAGEKVLETRQRICRLFNGSDERNVIFTQNVTMSLNMVIKGILKPGSHVLVSSMEHNAVMRPVAGMRDRGLISFDRIPCDPFGFTDPADVERLIRPDTAAVIMTHASNVNGAIQPIARIGGICRQKDILFIVDAAQSAGVLDIDMEGMCIDVLCFTGHKGLLGPQGTGGFVIGKRAEGRIDTVIEGGTGSASHLETMPEFLPDRFEAGTLNLPGIYGLCAGLGYIEEEGMSRIRLHEDGLCREFINGIKVIPGVRIVARAEDDRPYTAVVSLVFDGMDAAQAAFLLEDGYGIRTRVGLHCAPAAHRSLGTFPEGTVRFSFGYFNTLREIGYGIEAIGKLCERR